MQIKVFCIPLPGGEDINEEMNRFLRSHRVLQTESQMVSGSSGNFWCFAIKYLEGTPQGRVEKVDYRQVLDPQSFQRFSEMRKVRKRLAQEEGVLAYAVFTDEELAGLAQLEECTTPTVAFPVIGEKKIEKYGRFFYANVGNDEKSR